MADASMTKRIQPCRDLGVTDTANTNALAWCEAGMVRKKEKGDAAAQWVRGGGRTRSYRVLSVVTRN